MTRQRRKPPSGRRWIQLAMVIATVATLVILARHVDAAAVIADLARLDVAMWLAAVALVMLGQLGSKALRSQALLDGACGRAAPRLSITAQLLVASHAAGQLVWGPLGITVRSVGLARAGLPAPVIAQVQIGERIAEVMALALVIAAALLIEPELIAEPSIARVARLAAIAAVIVMIAIAASAVSRRGRGLLRRAGGALGPLVRAAGWAVLGHVADVLVFLAAARAAHLPIDVPSALLVFLIVTAATAIPLVPGQLGVMEAAMVVALAPAGLDHDQALVVALAYRLAHVVPLAIIGGPLLFATIRAPRRDAARAKRAGDDVCDDDSRRATAAA